MRSTTALTVAAGLALTALPTTASAAAAPRPLPTYVQEWTLPTAQGGNATADLGPAAPNAPVNARVYLAGRDPGGLARYAAAVSDPHNPAFHHYLDPAAIRARFGPTGPQVTAVSAWLARAGLRITDVNAHDVAVTGPADAAQRAFGVAWHSFRVPGSASTQQAPVSTDTLTAPAGVAAAVLTVAPVQTGLPGDDGPPNAPAQPGAHDVAPGPPCSTYYGQNPATELPPAYGATVPDSICGYPPQQMRSAYGVPDRLVGAGQTIAVIHPFRQFTAAADLATFGARHGQPLRPGQFTEVLPPGLDASCTGTTEGPFTLSNEETGDIELAHVMAPAARIVYVGAKCDNGMATVQNLDAMTTIIDHHLASIVSNSWVTGVLASPGMVAAYDQIFEQGAVEGIGFYFAAGDNGDNSQFDHHPHVFFPSADPWVTSVGGTSLAIGPNAGYEWEIGWADQVAPLAADRKSWVDPPGQFLLGSGGGTSPIFPQPAYQRGIVPDRLSHANNQPNAMRVIPDIAADADLFTGALGGETVTQSGQPPQFVERGGGGTSASTPLIAGMEADVQQATGSPVGFADPTIYAGFGTADYHDIIQHPAALTGTPAVAAIDALGSGQDVLITLGQDLGLATGPGYDDVTGVGTPAPGLFRVGH